MLNHSDFQMEEESNSESEEYFDTTESEGNKLEEDLEVFMMISNPLKQTADNKFEIIEGIPSDLRLTLISLN